MAENQNDRMKVIHYHSLNGATPKAENLEIGEIALSNKADEEKLFIKNTDGEIVSSKLGQITTDDVITVDAIEYSGETLVESGATVKEAFDATMKVIHDDEKVIAEAFNNLSSDMVKVKQTVISGTTAVTADETLTNVVKDVYTTIANDELATAQALNQLEDYVDEEIEAVKSEINLDGDSVTLTEDVEIDNQSAVEAGDTLTEGLAGIATVINNSYADRAEVTSLISGYTPDVTSIVGSGFSKNYTVEDALNDTEEIFAGAANDLNNRLNALSATVIEINDDYVTVNEFNSFVENTNDKFLSAETRFNSIEKEITNISGSSSTEIINLRTDVETSATTLDTKIVTLSSNTIHDITTLRTDTQTSAQTLYNSINNLSGATVAFSSATVSEFTNVRSEAASSAQTLYNYINNLSGATVALSSATVSEFTNVRSEAAASAQTLYNYINNLSGATVAFSSATVSEFTNVRSEAAASAQTLYNQISNLSGATVAFSGATVAEFANVRSEAAASAKTLDTKINNFSAATVAEFVRVDGLIDALESGSVKDVKYDSSKKYIYIERADGTTTTGFDASVFIKDGMLSAVTYDGTEHTMTFIWNTDAGHQNVTIDLDDIIAAYTGDNKTVKIENNTVSAIMDQANGVASYNGYSAFSATTTQNIANLSGATVAFSGATVAEFVKVRSEAAASAQTLYNQISNLSGATDSIINGLNATVSGQTSNGDVKVTVSEVKGKLTGVVVESNITSDTVLVSKDITYSGVTLVESGATVTKGLENTLVQIVKDEKVIATSLSDLDSRTTSLENNPTQYLTVGSGVTIEDGVIKVDDNWLTQKIEAKIDEVNAGSY